MREIKFRAWMEHEKRMIGWYDRVFIHCENDNRLLCEISLKYANDEACVLKYQQYTGKKDSTPWEELTTEEQDKWLQAGKKKEEWAGREIYENDIVEICNLDEDSDMWTQYENGMRARVAFGLSGIGLYDNKDKWLCFWSEGMYELGANFLDFAENAKIIGNKYENPELILEE